MTPRSLVINRHLTSNRWTAHVIETVYRLPYPRHAFRPSTLEAAEGRIEDFLVLPALFPRDREFCLAFYRCRKRIDLSPTIPVHRFAEVFCPSCWSTAKRTSMPGTLPKTTSRLRNGRSLSAASEYHRHKRKYTLVTCLGLIT